MFYVLLESTNNPVDRVPWLLPSIKISRLSWSISNITETIF